MFMRGYFNVSLYASRYHYVLAYIYNPLLIR